MYCLLGVTTPESFMTTTRGFTLGAKIQTKVRTNYCTLSTKVYSYLSLGDISTYRKFGGFVRGQK